MRTLLAIACIVAAPHLVHATVYDIHLGGMCSTQFSGGKGGGTVAEHSSGGYVSAGGYDSLCYSGKWTNHQTWWSCEYGSLNHYDMKMKGICNDGGASGCP